ncbi:type III secretion system protein PrgN [Enterococcus mundtii]|uniref:type III secretion system protein PrgN n=1 Tax=Enterococcus mundtii TaxID=53346 RepID=UPI001CCE3FFB|nr:type III secretion system protein PrgN [Enterococcus mundtii]UBM07023.1 type III secretion system protein PrgN [Enterococcus mundtii]UBM07060.1 type III secretion system protein PrgN [Enterococcus mundtii]
MSRNTFVYSHPINVFIIKYLGVTVDQFCESYGYSQGTVASWITRNRRVESLPVGFIYDLGLASSSNMSSTYEDLLSLQDEYEIYISTIGKRKKKQIE